MKFIFLFYFGISGLFPIWGNAEFEENIILINATNFLTDENFEEALNKFEKICPFKNNKLFNAIDRGVLSCKILAIATVESKSTDNDKDIGLVYWGLGQAAYEEGNIDWAIALYELAGNRNPKDVSNWRSLGNVLREKEDFSGAFAAFEKALEIDPDDPYTLFWVGSTYLDKGELKNAEGIFFEIVRIDPSHARVWFRLGEIEMKRGNFDLALKNFKLAKKKGVPKKYINPKITECKEKISKN